jgi:hypothetical protein
MAEPVGLATGIIAVIQLSERVLSYCRRFIGKISGAKREEAQIIATIAGLKGYFEFLQGFVVDDGNSARLPQLNSICREEGALDICAGLLKDIESKLQPERDYNRVLKKLAWPSQRKEIEEALEVIERQKTLIMLALQQDNIQAALTIEATVKEERSQVLDWLSSSSEFETRHSDISSKRERNSGVWFLERSEFKCWVSGTSRNILYCPGSGMCLQTYL